jgi:small-conductance mechanosensitive channel
MSIQTVNREIMSGAFTNDQLTSIIDAVKFARAQLSKQVKRSLMIGDNVNFTSAKTGQNMTGVVMKIAIKYITVRTVGGLWRVPANMLTLVEEWTPDNADFNDPGSRHHY